MMGKYGTRERAMHSRKGQRKRALGKLTTKRATTEDTEDTEMSNLSKAGPFLRVLRVLSGGALNPEACF
jgi:hypothetical protein